MGTYYKVLNTHGRACCGGSGQWNRPRNGQPGDWMPVIVNIEPCVRGYHLCRPNDLIHWLGPRIWLAEGRGESIIHDNKVVFSEARLLKPIKAWTNQTARLFACDCAEHVLPIWEKRWPNDNRPAQAIAIARQFADGTANSKKLAAARTDAHAAAWAATDATGSGAAFAASTSAWTNATNAAFVGAESARIAATDATANARNDAWTAERQWQIELLRNLLMTSE